MGQLAGRFTPAVYACDVEINREVVIYARETAQSPGGLPLGSRTGRGGGGIKRGIAAFLTLLLVSMLLK